jgi:ubiquinone/menaquinone biosynthesis C-methylase UbiE
MTGDGDNFPIAEHDWQSQSYVEEWIRRDISRHEVRRSRLREMLSLASLAQDSDIAVLDVGGGYGIVSEEVLRAFPQATVTLQDYSQPMLGCARQRLALYEDRICYVLADLCDPSWVDLVAGPFDLIVSAIAIHNLGNLRRIDACYRGIACLLKPGASFLDYDLFNIVGGVDLHMSLLRNAGFERVVCHWLQDRAAIVSAHSPT